MSGDAVYKRGKSTLPGRQPSRLEAGLRGFLFFTLHRPRAPSRATKPGCGSGLAIHRIPYIHRAHPKEGPTPPLTDDYYIKSIYLAYIWPSGGRMAGHRPSRYKTGTRLVTHRQS